MYIKDSSAHQAFQRAIKNFEWPVKIRKFEWDMSHWPILRAHHHFGLGLSLLLITSATSIQMHFRLLLIMDANIMNHGLIVFAI